MDGDRKGLVGGDGPRHGRLHTDYFVSEVPGRDGVGEHRHGRRHNISFAVHNNLDSVEIRV